MTMIHSAEIAPRRVLVVAYYFPPMGLSGVQRTLKFVKYLPLYGWHPTVLTVQPEGYIARDESLLTDLPSATSRVVRTDAAGPAKLFRRKGVVTLPTEWKRKLLSRISDSIFIPDNKTGWQRKAVSTALDLHREQPFDLIFATAPPFTDFLIGRTLKTHFNIPLVLDYRDPWVDYPFKFYPTPYHRWRNTSLERRSLRASSHVVTTNRRVKELILKKYRFLGYHDIDIISQGFDPEDFVNATRQAVPSRDPRVMRFTYAGVFWEDRRPDAFLRALHNLLKERPALRGRIEAVFVGTFRSENRKLVVRLGLQNVVRILDYLPHIECIRELLASDVLWMTVGDDLGSPGKVYEYLGARKPILACAPEGFLKSAVLEAGGTVVAPDDVAGIQQALLTYFAQWESGALKGPTDEDVEKYNRVILTRNLVRTFESLMEP
jgi:glycosyltransferase involved in cell wall biosynthesis